MRFPTRSSLRPINNRKAALLVGAALVLVTAPVLFGTAPASAGTARKIFGANSTGTWTVPQGVTEVQVELLGGSGGYGYSSGGGAGERIVTSLDVTSGTQYYVHVGADNGGNGAGGGGATAGGNGGNGGGASDLRTGTDDLDGRILVAAGGGGAGFYEPGGDAGQPGAGYYDTGAQPGSATAGGAAEDAGFGYRGGDGGWGQGGWGGCCGGGGGGGYYGGGGGEFGGGAGGSSYVAPDAGLHDTTVALGDRVQPNVTITYIAPTAVSATLTDLTLPADGTAQGTLTLTVNDSYGQGVPDDAITVAASDPNVQFGSVTDNLDGTYSVPVTASSTAGDVTVTATDASVTDVSAPSVLTLTALPQTVAFTSPAPQDAVVGGAGYTPSASGGPSDQPVVISVDASTDNAACTISNGVVSFAHAGNCVLDADESGNAQYAAAPTVSQTIPVGKGTQSVAFTSPAPQDAVVDGAGYTPTVSGGTSGQPVVISVDASTENAACSISTGVVSFAHVGNCVLDADRGSNDDQTAASTVQQTIAVGKGTQTMAFTSPAPQDAVVDGAGYTPTASGGPSDQPVVISVDASTENAACSISSGVVSFAHVGNCVLDADQNGNAEFLAAPTGQQTIPVAKGSQSVAFTSPAPQDAVVGGDSYTPTTSGGPSDQPVVISVDASTDNAACTISNGVVSFAHVGNCVLDADQGGTDDQTAASTVQQTIPVAKGTPTITFDPLSDPVAVGSSQSLTASSPSVAAIVFGVDSSTAAGVCTVTGNTVAFTGSGTCVVDAAQAASTDYTSAQTVTQPVAVHLNATTVSVQLATPNIVFGASTTATATISGTQHGAVQFEVAGSPVGTSVSVDNTATVVSAPFTGAIGANQVTAVFTPSDTVTYASATALAQTLTVNQALTTSAVTVTGATVSARVSAVAPGRGTPSGVVTFSIGGHHVGTSPLVHGVATLAYAVPTGSAQQVAAGYSGDASFLASSDSVSRHNPAISAKVSSAVAKSHLGWYRQPVKVTFTCTTNGAALTTACPAPVTLSASGAARTVSRTISATDGGVATVNVRGINIDRHAPSVRVVGVATSGRYFATAPAAKCAATDSLSGIAACRLTHHTRGTQETFTAAATDKAGNTSTRSVTVTLLTYSVSGAAFSDGAWTVRLGHTYTLLAVAHSRPSYVDAAPAPRRPAGLDNAFRSLGHGRWALGVHIQRQLHSHRYWNIGIKVGHTVHVLKLRVIR